MSLLKGWMRFPRFYFENDMIDDHEGAVLGVCI